MSENQKEYDNVKKELEVSMSVVRKANNALYIGVTAILAWAVTASNSTLCLLSYCVIIPVYFIALDYNIATMKFGAYLLVFHNDKWEDRLHKANCKKRIQRHASSYRNSFIYASFASSVLFFFYIDYEHFEVFEWIQVIVCIALFLLFNTYVFLQDDNDKMKQRYINLWEEIKEEEEQNEGNS